MWLLLPSRLCREIPPVPISAPISTALRHVPTTCLVVYRHWGCGEGVGIDISRYANWHALSVTNDGGYDAARAAVVAELAQVDALPSAEIEATIGDGKGQSGAYYDGFYM